MQNLFLYGLGVNLAVLGPASGLARKKKRISRRARKECAKIAKDIIPYA